MNINEILMVTICTQYCAIVYFIGWLKSKILIAFYRGWVPLMFLLVTLLNFRHWLVPTILVIISVYAWFLIIKNKGVRNKGVTH